MLVDLYTQACLTIKMLTFDSVEGKAPIMYLLDMHTEPTLETVTTLLYRCENLYNVRTDVTKIFKLVFQIWNR